MVFLIRRRSFESTSIEAKFHSRLESSEQTSLSGRSATPHHPKRRSKCTVRRTLATVSLKSDLYFNSGEPIFPFNSIIIFLVKFVGRELVDYTEDGRRKCMDEERVRRRISK
jgi:hypothetical protein